MDNQFVYIVTNYGCNSTPSDLWEPLSKIFINYEEAYKYFLKISPSLTDEENKSKQNINSKYNEELMISDKDYIIIENRVQIAGYHYGDMCCAKRPEGALIARCTIKKFDGH